MALSGLRCSLCPQFGANIVHFKLSEYHKHLELFHSHQPNFSVTCGVGGCMRTFKNVRTYRNHISGFHSEKYCDEDSPDATGDTDSEHYVHPNEADDGDNESTRDACVTTTAHDESSSMMPAALFILSLKEKQKLTQVSVQKVIEGVTTLFQGHIQQLRDQILEILAKAEVSDCISSINGLFSQEQIQQPFFGLETKHAQLKFYRDHFNLIDPESIKLGERRVWKGNGPKRRCILKEDHVMYVPVLKTLQSLLNNEAICAEVMNGHTSEGDILEDYCDGSFFKSHPLFSTRDHALQINFYYDDLEICNPLGSKAKIHKIGIFYFTLGNIRPKFRSRLSAIHVVAIVNHQNLQRYGIDAVITPFIKDIKCLEDGYEFDVEGLKMKMYGTISIVSADNLGSLALGGFKESCSSFRCCRHCMATQDTAKTKFSEEQFKLRNKVSHRRHCSLLLGPAADEVSKKYGLNRNSVLNELEYFHVCDGSLVPDIMHDVLEGALEYEVKLLLNTFIKKEKYFTLAEFNSRLQCFDLGYMESKDRPTLIADTTLSSNSNKLKQEAAQMWLLGRVLPLIIGDLVDEEDEHWENFLRLLDIVDILFSPKITTESVAYLASLIKDHHEEFQRLYPHYSKDAFHDSYAQTDNLIWASCGLLDNALRG